MNLLVLAVPGAPNRGLGHQTRRIVVYSPPIEKRPSHHAAGAGVWLAHAGPTLQTSSVYCVTCAVLG